MNYDTLFPQILKKIPNLKENDMCYHYQKKNNDNRKFHMFCPQGKKLVLNKNYHIKNFFNDHKQNTIQNFIFWWWHRL